MTVGFLTQANRNLWVFYAAGLLRSTGVGLTGVLLGVYLSRTGFSATQIGVVITAGLAASALGTLIVSLWADRLGRRRTLIALSLLAALGGVGLALARRFPSILLLAFIGMVSGMGTDRGPAFSLDQALIPQTNSGSQRTTALSWYSLIMDIGNALGALGAGLPLLLLRWLPGTAHVLQDYLQHLRHNQRPDSGCVLIAFRHSMRQIRRLPHRIRKSGFRHSRGLWSQGSQSCRASTAWVEGF